MYEEQIENGVKYLNNKFYGWLEKIDLSILDMVEEDKCIIGQLSGGFNKWLNIGNNDDNLLIAISCGFTAFPITVYDAIGIRTKDPRFRILTKEWIEKINQLRSESCGFDLVLKRVIGSSPPEYKVIYCNFKGNLEPGKIIPISTLENINEHRKVRIN